MAGFYINSVEKNRFLLTVRLFSPPLIPSFDLNLVESPPGPNSHHALRDRAELTDGWRFPLRLAERRFVRQEEGKRLIPPIVAVNPEVRGHAAPE